MSRTRLNGESHERIEHARDLFSEMAELIAHGGVSVRPWTSRGLPYFSALAADRQGEVLQDLESRVDLLQTIKNEGASLSDTPQLLWRALKRVGWVPQSDVFSYIESDDTVEVYGLDQRQTFRNIQFFRHVSFTLEQLHTLPWYTLTSRDADVQATLADAAHQIISGQIKTTMNLAAIPEHLTQEVGSEELRRFKIKMKCLSPVTINGQLGAIIAVNRTSPA